MKHNQLSIAFASCLFAAHTMPATVRYVDVNSTNPTPPFTNWATAATTIQDAVDAADPGDEVVVTNGVYSTGGRAVAGSSLTNRVAVERPLILRSVNGPQSTIIQGNQESPSVRCAYLTDGAVLNGFTLTNGGTRPFGFLGAENGGGVLCESDGDFSTSCIITNCVITGNYAGNSGGIYVGGGVAGGSLFNCTVAGNSADAVGGGVALGNLFNCTLIGNSTGQYGYGGGAYRCALNNCRVTANVAWNGGGAYDSTLNNCTVTGNLGTGNNGSAGGVNNCNLTNSIVYDNAAPNWVGTDNYFIATFTYSCTTPLPPGGSGNITNEPLFVNAVAGDYRLAVGSPCIDAGTNLTGLIATDLTGLPRPLDGNRDGIADFDMGAYEFNPLFFTSITRSNSVVRVSWFDTVAGMKLQSSPALMPGNWTDVVIPPGTNTVGIPLSPSNAVFRLML